MDERLAGWRKGWSLVAWSGAAVHAGDHAIASEAAGPLGCWKLGGDQTPLWFEADADIAMRLGQDALALEAATDVRLADAIGTACFAGLCSALWGDGEAGEPVPSRPPSSAERDERYGALCFAVSGLPAAVRITASRAWCDACLPPDPPPALPLTTRRAAVGATPVVLSARLDLGEVALAESLGWAVGELLITDAPLQPPVTLATAEGYRREGVLALDRGHRVVRLS